MYFLAPVQQNAVVVKFFIQGFFFVHFTGKKRGWPREMKRVTELDAPVIDCDKD